MKKIAFICELVGTKRQGGENLAMLRSAKSLVNADCKVDVFTYSSSNPKLKINSLIPLKLRLLPFVREMFFAPFIGFGLIRKLERKYNAIFASTMTIGSLYRSSCTVVIVCHLIRSQKFQTLSKIPKYRFLFNPITYLIMSNLEKMCLNNASKIVVIREHQKKYLQNKLGINGSKITVIPNGIDTYFFKPLRLHKKNQVIFVGRGTVPKGIDTLLEAAPGINATVLIVTPKLDSKYLEIAKATTNVIIRYNATPDEIVNLYSESKIFVLPSLNEEQPLSTMEAMACSLPVVVTKEAASDVVKQEINGFIIHERDPNALKNKINFLLENDELRKDMGMRNRNLIVQHYNVRKTSAATEKLLYA